MNSQSNTAALAQQQRDLLHIIFTTKNIAAQAINTPTRGINSTLNSYSLRGLQTYQANAAASAQRSLQTAYPVIAQLIGDDAFAHLARDFWAQHPPTCGDLAQWGGDLSGFIASIPALKTEPYLNDVAKAEWALHTAATAHDGTTNVASLALLTQHDPEDLTLQLATGTELIHSFYPVASILTAHVYGSPSFEEVGQKLRQNMPEIALVWRQGLRPRVALCSHSEAVFIHQLLNGEPLITALELAAAQETPLDFSNWLPQAVSQGLVLGAQFIPDTKENP
jgi:hypothetical protein